MTGFIDRLCMGLLSLVLVSVTFLQPAVAAMISTQQMLTSQSPAPVAVIEDFGQLQQQVVSILIDNGVSASDAAVRVNALTHQELALIQSHIESLPAGQGALAIAGAVFLVLLLLELVGVINIFNKL